MEDYEEADLHNETYDVKIGMPADIQQPAAAPWCWMPLASYWECCPTAATTLSYTAILTHCPSHTLQRESAKLAITKAFVSNL